MSRVITVAAAQLGPSTEDKKEVVTRMERLMEEAADRRVDMLGFPELALTQFFPNRLDRDNGDKRILDSRDQRGFDVAV